MAPQVSYPVNRDRSNAMRTRRGKIVVQALENLYFALLAAKDQAQIDGVYEHVKPAIDLVEQESIRWFIEIQEQDQASSMQSLADDIWYKINSARASAKAAKATGYISPLPSDFPGRTQYFNSTLEGYLEAALRSMSVAAGFSELRGRPYIDPVSGEASRFFQYVDSFDTSGTWDPVKFPAGAGTSSGGIGVGGGQ